LHGELSFQENGGGEEGQTIIWIKKQTTGNGSKSQRLPQ
jgi:hypothetical protein